jgi:hypothetical protein
VRRAAASAASLPLLGFLFYSSPLFTTGPWRAPPPGRPVQTKITENYVDRLKNLLLQFKFKFDQNERKD